MNKLYAKYLSIEITRRCNMSCAHCMRGDAQLIDIKQQYIKNVLKHFTSIHTLTITGGEPSLNPKAMVYILKILKRYNIHVYSFYIVTNGSHTSMSKEFIDICSQLYDYQECKESNEYMLEMSDDRFHINPLKSQVGTILAKYSFIGFRNDEKFLFLYKEGRSTEGYENPIYPIYLTTENYVYGDIYLNTLGFILSNGNLSYQRQLENTLCPSSSFLRYIRRTLRKS